jgi:arsenate reductase
MIFLHKENTTYDWYYILPVLWYLSIRTLPKGVNLAYHDIKQDPITVEQLEEMYQMVVMKRCLVKKSTTRPNQWDWKIKNLGEDDYKKYILEHYTFWVVLFCDWQQNIHRQYPKNMLQVMKALG